MADALGALAGARVRLWRFDGRSLRAFGSAGDPGFTPPIPLNAGLVPTPMGGVWLAPVLEADGFWVEIGSVSEARAAELSPQLTSVVGAFLAAERETAAVTDELTGRYEEIDLLYAISEILGRTVRLEEAAHTIVREVADVVGARRASIMVYDDETGLLRTVAARGFQAEGLAPVRTDDPFSVAARVFREQRIIVHDPADPMPHPPGPADPRSYRGQAFLSIPICYAAPGASSRCVGVINLTDRLAGDTFTPSEAKLVSAVANQIGAAIENARLVARDLRRQRLQRELELAHDLQLKLLPAPGVLQNDAEVAAICRPVDSVGGDFYTFTRLGLGRVGVMLGDVSSHGFSAALVMALVMSAAGIHAGAGSTPDEVLASMLESLGTELASTEMFLSVFYGVLDPRGGRLTYASAGHQHAFRIPRVGGPERLPATAPPLGLSTTQSIQRRQVAWHPGGDLLCLWTDGLVDQGATGAFTEERLLAELASRRTQSPEAIVNAIFAQADEASARPVDDRTLLVMRV
ncbi:MAG TPA: GAF domain-containing SpoIIE family protein phosphatase [Gemmatimonadales bacterium]|nr:GAF domain-containing SpoIIE family protein phosphatase [Gemmatimonadales bacterium]